MRLRPSVNGSAAMAAGGVASSSSDARIGMRIATAGILIPVTLALTWAGGWPFAILAGLCAALLSREWARVCGLLNERWGGWILVAGASLSVLIAGLPAATGASLLIGSMVTLLVLIWHWASTNRAQAVWLSLGAFTIILTGISVVWLRKATPEGAYLLTWLLAVVWASDSAAFFVGRRFGGPLLAPSISPSKTWSGWCGGIVGAGITGLAVASLFDAPVVFTALIAGMLLGIAGHAGDLFESKLKRRFDVKDSGGLVPGHGGLLDRLDSLLFAAPAAAALYLAGFRWL